MRFSSSRSSARSLASSEDSGSSIRKIAGLRTSARPIATRCISPPDSLVERLSSLWSMRTSFATSSTRRRISSSRHLARRRAQREGQVVEDRQMRIERILLEDEGDVARGRRQLRHVAAADVDRAAVGLLQPGDRAAASSSCRRRSARAARRTRRRRCAGRGRGPPAIVAERLADAPAARRQP